MTLLEISAEGWIAIIGALGVLVTTIGTAAVGIIVAINSHQAATTEAIQRAADTPKR